MQPHIQGSYIRVNYKNIYYEPSDLGTRETGNMLIVVI